MLFGVKLKITHGELQFDYHRLIETDNWYKARDMLETMAENFYDGKPVREDDTFYFMGGEIAVEFSMAGGVIWDIEEWARKKALIITSTDLEIINKE